MRQPQRPRGRGAIDAPPFQQVVSILQRSLPGKDERHEVLFLLDEFKHLGKLEAIETAITTIAGYKGRFMFIIQSLGLDGHLR